MLIAILGDLRLNAHEFSLDLLLFSSDILKSLLVFIQLRHVV